MSVALVDALLAGGDLWSLLSFFQKPAVMELLVPAAEQLGFIERVEGGLERVVRAATGPAGLLIIFVYSFLIAFILPGPSEVVLAAPLDLGLPLWAKLAVIILTSATGKAIGSVFAFHIGQEAKEAGPLIRWLKRSRFDVISWSEKRTVKLAQKYGYAGLALALSVPFFPDTLSIYAFAVLEEDYLKFALATFAGSCGRLLITIGIFGSAYIAI